MLVKPIGGLFVFALSFKRYRWIAALGLVPFILYTAVFWVNGVVISYVSNLWANLFAGQKAGPNQIITLNALLRFSPLTNWPDFVYKIIQYVALLGVILLSAWRRIHIVKAIFFTIVYSLCFYELMFR